jgi:calcium-dependent protein kinase
MTNWRGFEKLKKVALTVIASQLDDSEIKKLQNGFLLLDKDGNGVVSKQEFYDGIFLCFCWFMVCEGLKKAKVTSTKIDKIFNSMDSDKSGNIEYTGYNYSLCILIQLEFLAASMDRKLYLKEEKLMASFQLFDKDGNGKISPEELQAILGRNFHFFSIKS